MKFKYKLLHPTASAPERANEGDAGFDLKAISVTYPSGSAGVYIEICTGIALEIPKGYVGLIFPRSLLFGVYGFSLTTVPFQDIFKIREGTGRL